MGFKTIDLDAPGGYNRYKKLKETNSVQKAFEEEKFEEKFAPRPASEEVYNSPKESAVRQGVVTGVDQLRVRTKPEGEILYLISLSSVVTILDEMEGWYKVETAPGRVGWVMKQYIQVYTEGG